MKEFFKDIIGYEGLYQVSNLGRIKSLTTKTKREKILKQRCSNPGYMIVSLSKNGKVKTCQVHQLVLMSFRNHIPNGHKLVCNHKNFNKLDNRLKNLEIITQRENANKKHLKSSSKYTGVFWNKRTNKWNSVIVINKKKKRLGSFTNELEASVAYEKELAVIKHKNHYKNK